MLTSPNLQQAYIEMYKAIREYIWDFRTVETLANLEIETFVAFPNLLKVKQLYSELKLLTNDVAAEDKDLEKSMQKFGDLLEDVNSLYLKPYIVNEVIQDADIEDKENEESRDAEESRDDEASRDEEAGDGETRDREDDGESEDDYFESTEEA